MIIKEAVLERVCGITSQLPDNSLPEIALAGKSNVGKSSLLNCLVNRKSLARTSSEPGKTQTINYYLVNKSFYLVDLPGYGYAKVSQSEREKWGRMIENYLNTSRAIRAIILLIDIRHEPGENDKMMYDWIVSQGFTPLIIATKADKIKRSQLAKSIKVIRTALNLTSDDIVIPFSSQTGQGKEEVYSLISDFVTKE